MWAGNGIHKAKINESILARTLIIGRDAKLTLGNYFWRFARQLTKRKIRRRSIDTDASQCL